MASEAEAESLLAQLLRSGGDGEGNSGRSSLGLHTILVGLMGLPPADEETDAPPPGRIVLMNPRTGRMVVLQTDASMISEFIMEGAGRRGPPPASKASIEALRKLDPSDLEPDHECPVCLVETGGGGNSGDEEAAAVREMPCKHRFHEGCIKKWLGMHGSCPLCRFQMPVEEKEDATKTEEPPREEEEGEEGDQGPRMMMISISITTSPRHGIAEREQQQPRMDNID